MDAAPVTDEEFAALPPIINLRDYGLSWDWLVSKTTFRAVQENPPERNTMFGKPVIRSMHDLTDEEKSPA
jgi:hypothetical protein